MTRIFGDYAYSDGPRAGCWWDGTADIPACAPLDGDVRADVVIIGGGFTGLIAAVHLAEAGACVVLLEAQHIGWGASGRNGGFCCLGGGKLSDDAFDRRYGKAARLAFRHTEVDAVNTVAGLTQQYRIDVDRHSHGETMLAHRPKDVERFEEDTRAIRENYNVKPAVLSADQLRQHGMNGPFYGALTTPIGFGLNPRKYLAGLARAALQAGARLHSHSAVTHLSAGWRARTSTGTVHAKDVIVATNGYSSEALPEWLGGRYMPAQSTVLVTRPLTPDELAAPGWTSDQMAYDSRNLLHYFRLMPDRRFLFGMRGGLLSSPRTEARARKAVRRDFEAMFPAWAHVDSAHSWSGLVSLSRSRLPYVGPVPARPGLWTSLCYHGNGVAMASHAGKLLAQRLAHHTPIPQVLSQPLPRFPLGRWRRALMPPVYAGYALSDR